MKDLRRRRGMTAVQFAARCAQLGAGSITTNVIANIETHRREISLNELMIFALALDVAPLHLLNPDPSTDPDQPLVITATVQVNDPHLATRWIHGEEALTVSQERLYYEFSLAHQRAPETEHTLSQYAKAVVMDGAKRLASQYEAQAAQFEIGVREQITQMLTGLEDAVSQGTSQNEVLDALNRVRTDLSVVPPAATPKPGRRPRR